MRRSEVLDQLRNHVEALRSQGVKELFLFGSVARDEAKPGSDVDLLVEFEGPASFDRFMEVKFLLEDILSTRVDLVTPGALKPLIRPQVTRDAIRVA